MPVGHGTRACDSTCCRHIDAGILMAGLTSEATVFPVSGHPGVFAGVAGRVAAPLRMYEAHRVTRDRHSQGLRLSCCRL